MIGNPGERSKLTGYSRILAMVPDMPAPSGTGAAVRSFHLVRALAGMGELHLAVLGGQDVEAPAELAAFCRVIMRPATKPRGDACRRPPSRWISLKRAAAVLLAPWRRKWVGLYSYAAGCGVCVFTGRATERATGGFSRRLLAGLIRIYLNISARFFSPPPLMAFKHQGAFEELLPQIRESGAGEGYDLVWFEHAPLFDFAAQVMQSFPQARLVCNTHNIEYRLEEGIRRLESPGDVAGWIGDQSRVIARKEYRAFRRADLTFVCSDADRKHGLDLCPSGNFRVAGNGVDTTVFKPSPGRRPPARPVILFTGTMKYPPNRDAVAYFIREIFPLITAKIPDCLFMVAGRDAEEVLAELNLKSESILAVSNPPDMRPLFEQAALCVVPLRAGGGTRLKIPEAMAMECAVVSTSIGAEGVPYEPGTHLLIDDTEAGFAAAAVSLLSDLALRETVAAAAAEFIRRNYAWHVIARTAMDDLRSLKEESRV